jgi:hypothetical protein
MYNFGRRVIEQKFLRLKTTSWNSSQTTRTESGGGCNTAMEAFSLTDDGYSAH